MPDEPLSADLDEPIGWVVLDSDGHVVESGTLTHAEAVFLIGETSDELEQG